MSSWLGSPPTSSIYGMGNVYTSTNTSQINPNQQYIHDYLTAQQQAPRTPLDRVLERMAIEGRKMSKVEHLNAVKTEDGNFHVTFFKDGELVHVKEEKPELFPSDGLVTRLRLVLLA